MLSDKKLKLLWFSNYRFSNEAIKTTGTWLKVMGEDAYKILKELFNNTDYLNWGEVEKLLKSDQASKTWTLLNLALWYNHNIRLSN